MWEVEEDKPGIVNSVRSNFRKELLAAGLASAGFDPDRIFITRRRGSQVDIGKEISEIRIDRGEEGEAPKVFITTNRPGMYDQLPEGLFHQSITRGDRSKEAILKEIRVHREEEFYIRRFFSLYETEIERMRVDIQSVELGYDKPYRYDAFVSTLVPFWPVIKLMELSSAIVFVRLIPFIHRIRDSFAETAEAMTMILGDRTEIELAPDSAVPEIEFEKLGTARLGVNMMLDGTYRGVVPETRVMITPAAGREGEYVPGGRMRKIAESLVEIFIPARFPARIIVAAGAEDGHFTVGDPSRPCLLGVNSSLNATYDESQKQ